MFEQWKQKIVTGSTLTASEVSQELISFEGSVTQQKGGEPADGEDIGSVTCVPVAEALTALEVAALNAEQRQAFDIVNRHMIMSEADEEVPQLLMQLVGEAGTGKSRVIQTITDAFKLVGLSKRLQKGAFTGIAACLIGGQTLHSLFGMNI
ncbi:hypothetical protein M378DRAFT_83557, partial [Amanita muscaria Koide BX008]